MRLAGLARAHARMARRQRMLWFTVIPLTALALSIGLGSPKAPGTGGVEDLAFTGQILAVFTGVAYTAAFADLFTTPTKLGMHEVEAAAPIAAIVLRITRVLGAFAVVTFPSLVVLVVMAAVQAAAGNPQSLPGAVAVTVSIVAPAALIALAMSGLAGVLLPRAMSRIVAVIAWFPVVFSSPLLPVPTVNGTIFNVVGDAVITGYFHTDPFYEATGRFAFDGTAADATLSLLLQLAAIVALLVTGSTLADRARER